MADQTRLFRKSPQASAAHVTASGERDNSIVAGWPPFCHSTARDSSARPTAPVRGAPLGHAGRAASWRLPSAPVRRATEKRRADEGSLQGSARRHCRGGRAGGGRSARRSTRSSGTCIGSPGISLEPSGTFQASNSHLCFGACPLFPTPHNHHRTVY